MPVWLVPLIIATAGTAIVIYLTLRDMRATGTVGGGGDGETAVCSLCRRTMGLHKTDLRPLSGVDVGLVVQAIPEARSRKLAEAYCPHCQAAHVYAVDCKPPEWIGVNVGSPESGGSLCLECRTPLRPPPWGPGAYDGRMEEAPETRPDVGLVCPFCGGLSCIQCAEKATGKRTPDGSLLCPRCHRHPVDRFYHGMA